MTNMMNETHRCKSCHEMRPLSDFNGGIHSRCRHCDRERKRRWRAANKGKYALLTSCHGQARRAVKRGDIVKPDACERCGMNHRRLLKHHDRNDRPMEIIFLCDKCHSARHRELKAWREMPIAAN